jgi:DNA-binding NtrC family response regulator
MNREGGRILVVDDDVVVQKALRRLLETRGFHVTACGSGIEALRACKEEDFSVAFVDLKMPQMDGMELTRRLRGKKPGISIVMITAYGEITTAVEAMKQGAFHFMTKPFDNEEVLELATSAVTQSRESYLNRTVQRHRPSAIVGDSPPMQTIYALIDRVAPTDSTVLITGESGTGKELVARAIHDQSPRSSKPLVPVNCGSIPENLLESELFGHVKGAFTGALYSRPGRFSLADKGTIFLDEIGDMSLELQARLLRVLQEQTFERVGGTKQTVVDVRVVAATNKNLEQMVKEGRFREDLYYRLNGCEMTLPPLRERKEDIPALVRYFTSRCCHTFNRDLLDIDAGSVEGLKQYDWPGNIRELHHTIERCTLTADGKILTGVDLPAHVKQAAESTRRSRPTGARDERAAARRAELEEQKKVILDSLKSTGWNVRAAAKLAGYGHSQFYRLLKKHNVRGSRGNKRRK